MDLWGRYALVHMTGARPKVHLTRTPVAADAYVMRSRCGIVAEGDKHQFVSRENLNPALELCQRCQR